MKKLLLFTLLFICWSSQAASAEDQNERALPPIKVKVTGRALSAADFKDSEGSAQVTGGNLSLKAGGFSFGYQGRHYSWDGVDRLDFGNGNDDPWDSLHRYTLGYEHSGKITEDLRYSTAITASSAFEDEMGGSYGGALRGGLLYDFNEDWKGMLGVRVFTNSVRTSAMPYFGLMYEKYDEDGAGYFMTLGAPGTEAGYAFSETSKIRFNFSLDGRTYRLKDDSAVAKKGYLETSSMVTGIYYDWQSSGGFSISLGPEYHFAREMKLYDEDGDKLDGTIKQDAALGGSLQLGYTF